MVHHLWSRIFRQSTVNHTKSYADAIVYISVTDICVFAPGHMQGCQPEENFASTIWDYYQYNLDFCQYNFKRVKTKLKNNKTHITACWPNYTVCHTYVYKYGLNKSIFLRIFFVGKQIIEFEIVHSTCKDWTISNKSLKVH